MDKNAVEAKLKDSYNKVYKCYRKAKEKDFPLLDKYEYSTERNKIYVNCMKNSIWPSNCPETKEPGNIIIELAIDRCPEAYFEACKKYSFRNSNASICPNEVQDLFVRFSISQYELTIRDFIQDYYNKNITSQIRSDEAYTQYFIKQANEYARNEWRKGRECIFCGPTGDYEEKETWEWIEKYIIPHATKDIWEDLDEFYNGENACVPPEDQEKFNEIFKAKNGITKDKTTKIVDKTSKNKRLDKKTEIEIIKKEKNFDVFWSFLAKKKKSISEKDLLYAFFAMKRLESFQEDEEKKNKLMQLICIKFQNADEETIKSFISTINLTIDKLSDGWDLIRKILKCKLPISIAWTKVIKEMFYHSKDGDGRYLGWWIGCLEDLKLFREIVGQNLEFWKPLSVENIKNVLNCINICLPIDQAEEAKMQIYQMGFENREQYPGFWEILKGIWMENAFYSANENEGRRLIRQYQNLFCSEKEDYEDITDYLFKLAFCNKNKETEKINCGIHKADFLKSFTPIEGALTTLKKEMQNKQVLVESVETHDIYKYIQELEGKLSYFKEYWEHYL